jgi:hypothetical protein
VKPGDVVHHIRTGERLFVESVEGRCVFVAWYTPDGQIHRKAYGCAWLVEKGMALA